ncbi:MAG: glycosyltransferase [Thermoanaerobaculia bacterium]
MTRLTQAEFSHGTALEYLASQLGLLRDRAELAEGGQRHLEQLAAEMQTGLEHTHGLAVEMWRSAAWTRYRSLTRVFARFAGAPGQRSGRLREMWRRRREASRERRRQTARLTAELATKPIALPSATGPRAEILLFAASGDQALRCLESMASTPTRVPYRVHLVVGDRWFPVGVFRSVKRLRILAVKGDPWRRWPGLLKRLQGDIVVCLDARVRVAADWLDRLAATFEDFADVGMVGARVVDEAGRIVAQGGVVDRDGVPRPCRPATEGGDASRAREVDYVGFECLAVDRALALRLGAFRSDLGSREHRWADLCLRARAAGAAVYVQPAAIARLTQRVAEEADARNDVLLGQTWRDVIESRPATADPVALLESLDRRPRLLVVDHRLPTPDQDSGSLRMGHALRLLREIGYRVTFVPANLKRFEPYACDLEALGIEVVSAPVDRTVGGYLERVGDAFEVALVSRAHIAAEHLDAVREHCPSARVVFDTVDLQFLRLQRQAELEKDEDLRVRAGEARAREVALARKADLTLVVSDVEKELLAHEAPDLEVRVLSNIHHVYGAGKRFEERSGLLFIGGFEHPPNVDAVLWLVEEILPLVHRRLPDVHASIIGSKPTTEVRELASERVTIAGYVPDVAPYFERARLSVAPLRYGAGVKGKVNQSLAHGLPCIATSCAAEGMGLTTGQDVLIADDAASFADAIVRAYSDAALWGRLSEGGLRNTQERFSVAAARRDLEAILADLRLSGERDAQGSVLVFPPGNRTLGA